MSKKKKFDKVEDTMELMDTTDTIEENESAKSDEAAVETDEATEDLESMKAEKKAERRERMKSSFTNKTFKNGSFSVLFIIAAFVIVVLVNVVVRSLPSTITQIDLNDLKLNEVGEETINVLDKLDQDIILKVLAKEDNVDSRISMFLERYAALSDHVKVQYVDPVTNPTVLTAYNASANSIVVESQATKKTKIVPFTDIILTTIDYNTYSYREAAFDGENQITNAILVVQNAKSYKIYELTGHGEIALGENMINKIGTIGATTVGLNLSTAGGIPEDCDLLVINAPSADLSDDETKLVLDYLVGGGSVTYFANYVKEPLKNMNSILREYGIKLEEGYLGDTNYYYAGGQSYFNLYTPVNGPSSVAKGLESAYAFVENSQAFSILDDVRSSVTVSPILVSSNGGFLYKEGTDEENLQYAKYYIALEAFETVEKNVATLTVYGSPTFIADDLIESIGSVVANDELFINTCSIAFGGVETVSIDKKSLSISYNMLSGDAGSIANILFAIAYTGIIPLGFLIVGFVVWIRRRRR